ATINDTFNASTPAESFGALTVDGGTFTGTNGPITVGDFTLVNGASFTSTSNTLSVGGNYSASSDSTFTHNSGTVAFTKASSTQTLDTGGSGVGSFNNVTHTGNGTLQLTNNTLTIGGTFQNTAGTFDFNGQTATVTGTTTLSGGTTFEDTL